MHKYFAKPLFLGKKVEFLPECHSTNEELLIRAKKHDITEGFLIYSDHQVKGKGQRGNVWLSEPGKNLLFSFFVSPGFLLPRHTFYMNIVTGLALVRTLQRCLQHITVELKWPNDTYVNDRKIAGVLIETNIEAGSITGAVIGVGLNVNQEHFHLPTATSLKMEAKQDFDRMSILESCLVDFETYYLKLKAGDYQGILAEYYQFMRWRGEEHMFKAGGVEFEGEILGIDDSGRLSVKVEDQVKRFDVKEIEFLY